MPSLLDMMSKAVTIVTELERNKYDKDAALQIKKEFENTFHGTWQCVVGKVDSIKARTLARRSVSKRDT